MKWPALFRDRRVQIGGAAVAWVALVLLFMPKQKRPESEGWLLLAGDDVKLRRGFRYRGCVDVPFFVSPLVTVAKLKKGVEDKGFTDVIVVESRPSAWPDVECDYFVEATWGKADEALERPGAVEFAWERAPE